MNGTMTPTTNGRWNNHLLEHGFTFTYPHWPDATRPLSAMACPQRHRHRFAFVAYCVGEP
jgi:hypothetical protein